MALARIRSILVVLVIALGSGGAGWWFGQREIATVWRDWKPEILVVNKAVPPEHRDVDFSLFWEVWDRLERDYLDSAAIQPDKMVYGAIAGMTASLGDPYTVFLPPKQQEEAKAELAGEFEGIGIQLGYKDGRLAVIAPLDGSPAKAAGLQAGDIIVHIKDDGKKLDRDTEGMTLPDAVDAIRGPAGSPVILSIVRASNDGVSFRDPFDVTITRDTITVKSATVEFIKVSKVPDVSDVSEAKENSMQLRTFDTFDTFGTSDTSDVIAYIRLSRFGDKTGAEWNDIVNLVIKAANKTDQPLTGIVLDMRNNPGGYLEGAVAVASEFFEDGMLVEQKGKSSSVPFPVEKPGRLSSLPLVVLINEGSASASEIVAGAIQARERGKLVGANSFGKGTVQDAQELRGGAGIHVTTARWLLPNGNWIHEEGLKPDVEVEYDEEASKDQKWDNQVVKALEVLSQK